MSTRTRLFLFAALAIALAGLPLIAYIGTFGAKWSSSQEVWGQFGDFFGGFLNPLFALIAFIAVLANLQIQTQQLDVARDEFRASAKSTQEQIDVLREQASRQELVAIIRALSDRIDMLCSEVVSPVGTHPELRLFHVIHEGWRLRTATSRAGPYENYVHLARSGGTMVEALHNRLRGAADDLAYFLPLYEAHVGKGAPILRYYSHRFLGLGLLLADVGGAKGSTVDFFRQAERESAA